METKIKNPKENMAIFWQAINQLGKFCKQSSKEHNLKLMSDEKERETLRKGLYILVWSIRYQDFLTKDLYQNMYAKYEQGTQLPIHNHLLNQFQIGINTLLTVTNDVCIHKDIITPNQTIEQGIMDIENYN